MSSIKAWYMSRTIWASLVTIAMSLAGLLGLPTDGVDAAAVTDTLLQAITGIAGIVTIVCRIAATSKLK